MFHLRAADSSEFAFKIVHPDEDEATLDFQIQALNWIARHEPKLKVPRVQRARRGTQIVHTIANDRRHAIWMLNFLPGVPMMETKPSLMALFNLGRFAGRIDRALRGYFHPAAGCEIVWDVRLAPRLKRHLSLIEDRTDRELLERIIDRFAADASPTLSGLPAQVIHNDMNFHNVLVAKDRPDEIAGLIDFGDMLHGPLIMELANAASDAVLDHDRPLEAVAELLKGYDQIVPLSADEVAHLFDLVQARQALGLAVLASRRMQISDDPSYLESYAIPCMKA
ncbi:MAG: phosphotransferase, partial [Burkholderiales bacterium]